MAVEVSSYLRDQQPYSCVGVLFATWADGSTTRGTCTLVGQNDILTATHCVYDPDKGGWATGFSFYFGADYNESSSSFDDYGYAVDYTHWVATAWPNGSFTDGDNNTFSLAESQFDIAIIGIDRPVGTTLGWLGMASGYESGVIYADAVGYPSNGTGMMIESSIQVLNNPSWQVYESSYSSLGPGSSGGPLLVGADGGVKDTVIGVKSTTSSWADLSMLWPEMLEAMSENDSLIDTIAPTPIASSPGDGAIGVPVNGNITVTFSEAIQRGSGTIALKNGAGDVIASYSASSSSNLTISGNTLTINPTNNLSYNTFYRVEFMADSIKDLAGNGYVGDTSYDFRTAINYSLLDDSSVYRFFNSVTGTHFYSGSKSETVNVATTFPEFVFEGEAFNKNMSGGADAIDVFRFYNTTTRTHFYTASKAEVDIIKSTLPNYGFEGVAFQAHSQDSATTTELYRFYNTQTGAHFYTASQTEMENIKVTLSGVMNYEGVAYYVDL